MDIVCIRKQVFFLQKGALIRIQLDFFLLHYGANSIIIKIISVMVIEHPEQVSRWSA